MLRAESYDIFCLFCRIYSSTKKTDDFAFFIYFTFKGGLIRAGQARTDYRLEAAAPG